MHIDVIYDTVCPWCYIGKRRLEQALRLRPHVKATTRWRPFLLNPAMPPEGIDRTAYLINKFGSEARVRRTYGAIAEAGQSVEIDFAFERIGHTPNSVNSHRLVHFADNHHKADAAVEALFLTYFVNGQNIGNIDVLLKIGKNLGLDADALGTYLDGETDVAMVHDENARAHRMGVNGVPSFIFAGEYAISGAQTPDILARVLDAAGTVRETAQ
ncbi:MAG: DsbA family oxidoreductase [Rhodospirillales bacterium]|jgi:predicted DsbA family dithiol-disulfide isomerase|nr:DsbA family oxidoreductase [Rhodospirillales bacterium]MDP6882868.1 DsbA family oxidoreductase [Rhodospirillales bacterium]